MSSDEVLETLLAEDEARARRQVGIVDAKGNARTVVTAMAEAFENTEGDLGTRMLAALEAGQEAGGDSRGRQSAAILVVKEGGGYGGQNDRYRDYRVDDHTAPIQELKRIYQIGNRRRGRRR